MAENNYNMIKPVESLQNILRLTPTERREERKRRRSSNSGKRQASEEEQNGVSDERTSGEAPEDNPDQHSIDYCA
ncbi:MAG: hypothetical protein ACYST6_17520 [Planctomycetota bacterium]|jgi:hypothetical protein